MTTESSYTDTNLPLSVLTEDLASLIETFIHLGVQVHDFQGTEEAKAGLANNINKVITQLKSSLTGEEKRKSLEGIEIPLEILNYIEDGRNPDIYTREFVEVVRKINQYLNGKSLAFEQFRDVLGDKIKQEFPELTSQVDDIKQRTNVE